MRWPLLTVCIILFSLFHFTDARRTYASANTSQALAAWSDLKFGLFLHWGIYSVWGVEASWSLEWSYMHSQNPNLTEAEQTAYRKAYWDLNKVFDPKHYDPVYWAKIAKAAGFKYVVMTTKHHDGFNMYATQLSDYSVMGPESPCQRDLYGELVTAFKNEGIMVGAYYSKADWHSKWYWSSSFPSTRDVDYDPEQKPELWSKFVAYDQGQLEELMRMYNPDILWLDGEWVMPSYEDIFIEQIGSVARSYNPNVLMVNRRGGVEEDYLTPEETGSDYPYLDYWESCNIMGTQWSYKPNDDYKSTTDLLNMLLSVVSNGGNLLLDIGPSPDGEIPSMAQSRMADLGKWLGENGESVYSSHVIFPYQFVDLQVNTTGGNNTWYVQWYLTSKRNFVYMTFMPPWGGYVMPSSMEIYFRHRVTNNELIKVEILGSDFKLNFNFIKSNRLKISNLPPNPPNPWAVVFKLTYQKDLPIP